MADAAKTHKNGRPQAGNKDFGSVDNVNMSPVDTPSNNDEPETRRTNADRIPDHVKDPTQGQDFAFDEKAIQENYPFFGDLLKRKNSHYRRITTISKQEPTCIEEVERKHGPGYYEVRLQTKDGQQSINFRIADDSAESETVSDPAKLKSENDISDKLKQIYEARIKSQEDTIRNLRTELDRTSDKVRELKQEGFEEVKRAEREFKKERRQYEREIDNLKDELRDIKQEKFELKMELKFSDKGGTLDKFMDTLVSEDGLLAKYGPMVMQAMQQQNGQLALNGPQQMPNPQQQQRTNPGNPQPTPSEASAQEGENQQQETQDQNEQDMQTSQQPTAEQVKQAVKQEIISQTKGALQAETVDQNGIATYINQVVTNLDREGLSVGPDFWIDVSKQLVKFVNKHDIATEKLGKVIQPVLGMLPQIAIQGFKNMPVNGAIGFLQNQYSLNMAGNEKEILKEVLTYFKKQL